MILLKRLTKIKLINWHLFTNQTIEIKDNTLISGENGSGKSTLLDALQFLLVGGKAGVKFNIAATDEAKRSLEGYVRGRIGAENKEFLRNNDVITHVALEFYDQQNDQFGIIGCILELPKNGQMKDRFYLIENLALHENMFLEKKLPRDYKSMKAYLKTLDLELQPFDSQKQYRNALARYFGLDAKKYARILPKALAFRPIDLQAFVFEFLLDDDPIDIGSLKNNVQQLKRIEGQIRLDREKLEKLNKIIDLGQGLNQNLEQLDINQMIEKMSFIEKRENFLATAQASLDKVNSKYDELKREKERMDNEVEENDRLILQLESARNQNDLSRTLNNLQEQLDKKGELYENQKQLHHELRTQLSREINVLKEFVTLSPNTAISAFLKYYQTQEDHVNIEDLSDYLNQVSTELSAYHNALLGDKTQLEKERVELTERIRNISNRLNALKRNVKTYPRNVESLIEAINTDLSAYYEKEVRVRPFCELFEIQDETWRNAIEGYLGSQRFDLIIDPLYFNDALDVYDRVKSELKIYGVGLVNTAKIMEYQTYQNNSLASKVLCEHPYAKHYVNMRLGHVIAVEDVQDLKNHPRSITKTAMTYGSYTARQINPNIYATPYIGQQATGMQIDLDEKELLAVEEDLSRLTEIIDKNQQLLRLIGQSKITQIVGQNRLRYLDLHKQTRKEYIELETRIQSLEKDPNLSKFEEQLNEAKNQKRQLKIDWEAIVGRVAQSRSDMQQILDQIDTAKESLKEHLDEQKELTRQYPLQINTAHLQFNALKKRFNHDYEAIARDLAQSSQAIRTQNARHENEVINLMRSYINNYHFGAAPDISELIHFEKEATLIRDNNLMRYEQEAIELRRNTEVGFKEEFVNKLRSSIESAQQQIEELNMALQGKTFGADSYQLITRASDNPEFKQYYEIIMHNDAVLNHTLFTENLSKKHEVILMELFNKIASFDPENDKFAMQFLDYRYYLSYDIEVINENGNRSYFSKVSREKSGGETQVPFYIVIAASFQQLLTKNRRVDSGCIVLFDEAFNNMDESRIDAMMKFYNSLSIQLFIAVPPQRVSNIINYVNTSLAIVKDNDYAIVETFKRDGAY